MGTTVTVPCASCGDEVPLEVEPWTTAPTEVYCDDDCYRAREAVEAAPTLG
jgi:hypothetical protein